MTSGIDERWIFDSLMAGNDITAKIQRIKETIDEQADTVKHEYSGLAVVGTDLDRTMVYSQNSMQIEDGLTDDLLFKLVEVYEKRPLSFMTSPAYLNLEIINSHAHLVPVTTRTEKQFKRIKIPGTTSFDMASERKQYAVTTNGAKILVNGVADKDWSDKIASGFEGDVATVDEAHEYMKQFKKAPWVRDYRNAEDYFLYMQIDRAEAPEHTIQEIRSMMDSFKWTTSLQGRKIYFVPEFISKGAAFSEIIKRVNGDYSIACGDSLLDVSLMEAADISIRPRHGELEDVGYTAANNVVTKKSGIFAGEEITARILAQVYAGAF